MISTRPQPSTMGILPIFNSELTKKPESTSYNWKTLTKAGLVFVATTGAFLTLKTTKSFGLVSSWLKNRKMGFDERETKLAVLEKAERVGVYSGHQRTDLSLTGFGPSEVLQTEDSLQQTDPKESPLAAVKDSHKNIAFVPQRAKRNPIGMLEKVGPEFQVNTYTTIYQEDPSVAGLSDGKFVVTWHSSGQDGDLYGIYGQMFRAYDSSASGYSSSSQQIPRSSTKISSSYDSITSSLEISSSIITSDTKVLSYSSEQSTSSAKRSSSSKTILRSSSSSRSIETSGSYNSISNTLETFSSTKPISSMKSTSYSTEISSLKTSSLSDEPIYSDSAHDEGLNSAEITGIVLGAITAVGLCVTGGFFAVKRICKSDRDQSIEDVELDTTIPKTFRCSLTGKMMNEPVEIVGERDCFYDREAIEQYFAREHKTPSGKSLKKLVLIPNYDLRSQIDEYKESLEQPSAPQLEV